MSGWRSKWRRLVRNWKMELMKIRKGVGRRGSGKWRG